MHFCKVWTTFFCASPFAFESNFWESYDASFQNSSLWFAWANKLPTSNNQKNLNILENVTVHKVEGSNCSNGRKFNILSKLSENFLKLKRLFFSASLASALRWRIYPYYWISLAHINLLFVFRWRLLNPFNNFVILKLRSLKFICLNHLTRLQTSLKMNIVSDN